MKIRGTWNIKINTFFWNTVKFSKYPSKYHGDFMFRKWCYWSKSRTLQIVAVFCMLF